MATYSDKDLPQRLVNSAMAWLNADAAILEAMTLKERDEDEEITPKNEKPKKLRLIVAAADEGRHTQNSNAPIRNIRLSFTVRGNSKTTAGEAPGMHAAAALIERKIDDSNLLAALDSASLGVRVMLAVRRPGSGFNREGMIRRQRFEIECKCVAFERTTDAALFNLADFAPALVAGAACYKDTGATIPATLEGDVVMAWKDPISGLTAVADGEGFTLASLFGTLVIRSEGTASLTIPSGVTLWPSKRGALYIGFRPDRGVPLSNIVEFNDGSRNAYPYVNSDGQSFKMYDSSGFLITNKLDDEWEHQVFVREDDTTNKFYKGGVLVDTRSTSAPQFGSGYMRIGTAGGQSFKGYISAILLTAEGERVAEIDDYVAALAPINPATKIIVTDGNSLSCNGWQDSAQESLGTSWRIHDVAMSGYTTAQRISAAAADVDAFWPEGATQRVLYFWELTNDVRGQIVGGATDAATIATEALGRSADYVAARRAASPAPDTIIQPNMMLRADDDLSGPQIALFADVQAIVNAALATNAGGIYGDIIVDVAAQFPDPLDTTYFRADKVHLNATGAELAGELFANALP